MPREHNFLLGFGERLSTPVDVPTGGGDKHPAYDFETAKERLANKLASASQRFSKLPDSACPEGEVVAVVTMHPRYISKSDFPDDLLRSVGLRSVGSRPRAIKPEKWGIEKHPEEAITEDIFVAGSRAAYENWANRIEGWSASSAAAREISHIEDVGAFEARDKLKSIPIDKSQAALEIVLHNAGSGACWPRIQYRYVSDARVAHTPRRIARVYSTLCWMGKIRRRSPGTCDLRGR